MIATPALRGIQERLGARGLGLAAGACVLAVAAVVTTMNQGSGAEAWVAADVAVKLTAVVALIYGSAWALRRTSVPARLARGGVRPLRVLDTISLGQRRSIHVVRAGNRTLVIGATATQLSLLSELPEGDGELWEQPGAPAALSFQDVLSQVVHPTSDR